MKCFLSVACVLSVLVALSYAAPMPQSDQALDARSTTTRIAEGINNKLRMLRMYCPQLFQVIDNVIQNVTSTAFRVIGRAVLQSGGLGGGGGGGGESRVSVVLPTFGPDEDYDDEDEDDNAVSEGSTSSTTTTTSTTSTPPQTIPDADTKLNEIRVEPNNPTEISQPNTNDLLSLTSEEKNIGDESSTEKTLYTSPAAELSRRKRDVVRTIRAAENQEVDQDVAASGGNGPSPSDDLVDAEDADRDKRFSPFGGSFGASAGSTGGSGNFLFDIIRRTADGAARAAGTVYRMIAGTESTDNYGVGLTATATSARFLQPQLIAGSGATEESDEKENGPIGAGGVAELDVAKDAEGIPGPVTRLFVLANRGLANLVQDLILRLAQTSERIVNFKARLITALI